MSEQVRLPDLITKQLLSDIVDAIANPKKRQCAAPSVQRHVVELLKSFLLQRGVDFGGARTPEAIPPVKIRTSELLRTTIKNGKSVIHPALMLWAENLPELQKVARRLADSSGLATNTFDFNHFHPFQWEAPLHGQLTDKLLAQTPNARRDEAALMLYVVCEDAQVACETHRDRRASGEFRSPSVTTAKELPALMPSGPDATTPESQSTKPEETQHPRPSASQQVAVGSNDKPLQSNSVRTLGNEPRIPADHLLTAQQRRNLRDLLRAMNAELGMGPLRHAAKETGLLGKDARKLDPGSLKKTVPDADYLSKLIADALDDRAHQASGVRTLQRIALEASRHPTLDSRAQTQFQKALKALETGDWSQLSRSTDALHRLQIETGHPLLEYRNALVMFLAGDLQRVSHVLLNPETVPTSNLHPAHRPTRKVEATPTTQETVSLTEAVTRLEQAADDAIDRATKALGKPISFDGVTHASARLNVLADELKMLSSSKFRDSTDARERSTQLSEAIRTAAISHFEALRTTEKELAETEAAVAKALGASVSTLVSNSDIAASLERVRDRIRESNVTLRDRLEELSHLGTSDSHVPPPTSNADADVGTLLREMSDLKRVLESERERRGKALVPVPSAPTVRGDNGDTASLPIRFATSVSVDGILTGGLVGRLRTDAQRVLAPENLPFLPLELLDAPRLYEVPPGSTTVNAVNAVASNLLTLWAHEVRSAARPFSQLLEFIPEAGKLRTKLLKDAATPTFSRMVLALGLSSAADDRTRSRGQRRIGELVRCTTDADLSRVTIATVQATRNSSALVRVASELVAAEFDGALITLTSDLAPSSPADCRRVLDALAIALVLSPMSQASRLRSQILKALGADPSDYDQIEDFVTDAEQKSRRASRPEVPRLKSTQPLVTDFVGALGLRSWERGKNQSSLPKVSVALPKGIEKGLYVLPGSRNIDVPIVLRNSSTGPVGGVSAFVGRPPGRESAIVGSGTELHVPWLTDSDLEESASVVLSCPLELNPEKSDDLRELRLSIRTSWFGGKSEETCVVPVRQDAPSILESAQINGYDGQPINLNDDAALSVSSGSVQRCYTKIRDQLRDGKSVRAIIYGRRRRGKSSICVSLNSNPKVQAQFATYEKVWNGPRMTSVATGFTALSDTLVGALARRGISAQKLDVSDLSRAEEVSERFLHWFDSLADSLKEHTRVLLLLDEFQKWLAGLASRQERLALLEALRHFNDRAGKLDVSFVLSGLQNLRSLVQESTDLANALEAFEIRALTNEESERYVRERLPFDLDGRTRRRLVTLSGGNPYVLNRLGGNLLESLKQKRRRWCTAADVDALLDEDDAQSGRLSEFVKYMLHEDEDDNAATLRQLTVLRAAASTLHERGDFDGYVRVTDVESWLTRGGVEFEAGQPQEQLEELAKLDLLQVRDGGRFYLRGEWLCRALAVIDPARVKLLPVSSHGDPDLVLGRFRRKRQMYSGGEGEIWIANNVQEGGQEVVLKIYPQSTIGLQHRIDRERAVLEKIVHPNVVGFHGADVDPRHGGVLVLEYIDGKSLLELLKERPTSAQAIMPGGDIKKQLELLKKLAGAVEACHSAGVVHKDLSPANVMATLRLGVWEPKLIDFGLSGFETQPVDSSDTTSLGTVGYVAPEKIKLLGARRTPKADVYSLGALFIRLLCDREPGEVIGPRLAEAFTTASVPKKLGELIERMVADDAVQRPTAGEVLQSLETALEPLSWRELTSHAEQAFVEDRWEDAIRLFGQALAAVPINERSGDEYITLLQESLDLLRQPLEVRVSWDIQWLGYWFDLVRRSGACPIEGRVIVSALRDYRATQKQAGTDLTRELARTLSEADTLPVLASFVALLAREEFSKGPLVADVTFEFLASYCAARHLDASVVEDYCVGCARTARVKMQDLLGAELWLQRARRLGIPLRSEYENEAKALEESRKKTKRNQTLPPAPAQQEPVKIGVGEKGHLNVDRLTRFDENVRRRFPFVYCIQRVTKDPRFRVSRPTLLGLDNLGSHLPTGQSDPGNVIPLVLDGSFTGDNTVLRTNIVLTPDTTRAQREAAYNVLRAQSDLFDCAE